MPRFSGQFDDCQPDDVEEVVDSDDDYRRYDFGWWWRSLLLLVAVGVDGEDFLGALPVRSYSLPRHRR